MNRTKVDIVNKKTIKESDDVFESIHKIMHLFRSEQYRVLRDSPYELTHMEGKLLGFFERNPGASLRDLVGHMRQDKGQLARLIKSLREQGLLEGRDDEGDRRSVRIHLTAEGLAIHQTLRHQVAQLSEQAIQGLSPKERTLLVTLLHQVRTNLESVPDGKAPSKKAPRESS